MKKFVAIVMSIVMVLFVTCSSMAISKSPFQFNQGMMQSGMQNFNSCQPGTTDKSADIQPILDKYASLISSYKSVYSDPKLLAKAFVEAEIKPLQVQMKTLAQDLHTKNSNKMESFKQAWMTKFQNCTSFNKEGCETKSTNTSLVPTTTPVPTPTPDPAIEAIKTKYNDLKKQIEEKYIVLKSILIDLEKARVAKIIANNQNLISTYTAVYTDAKSLKSAFKRAEIAPLQEQIFTLCQNYCKLVQEQRAALKNATAPSTGTAVPSELWQKFKRTPMPETAEMTALKAQIKELQNKISDMQVVLKSMLTNLQQPVKVVVGQ